MESLVTSKTQHVQLLLILLYIIIIVVWITYLCTWSQPIKQRHKWEQQGHTHHNEDPNYPMGSLYQTEVVVPNANQLLLAARMSHKLKNNLAKKIKNIFSPFHHVIRPTLKIKKTVRNAFKWYLDKCKNSRRVFKTVERVLVQFLKIQRKSLLTFFSLHCMAICNLANRSYDSSRGSRRFLLMSFSSSS